MGVRLPRRRHRGDRADTSTGTKSLPSDAPRHEVAERVRSGATESGAGTVLRGKDLQKWLEAQFGRSYFPSGIYDDRTWPDPCAPAAAAP